MSEPASSGGEPSEHSLTGSYRVRIVRPALREAARILPRAADFFDLRAQALKLRYWPEHRVVRPNGRVLDLDWEWIKALHGQQVGELRIDDTIGGQDNLRVIFFVGDPGVKRPLPMVWLLAVMQKKRQGFTAANIENFRCRRVLVVEHFYKSGGQW